MKDLLLFLLCLNALYCRSQAVVVQTQKGTAGIHNSGYSAYGYPWSALAGSDREQYVSVFAEVDNITAWSGNGSSVTFTASNHLSANDVVSINGGTSTGWPFNWQIYQVVSATPTTFTVSDGNTGSGNETSATVSKRSGAGFSSLGTWEIINTVGSSETYRLYTQDGTQSTDFSGHPTITGAPQFINFEVGPIPGSCFTSGSITTNDFAIHSTIEFDIKFTSADDSTKTGSYHYVVCANGGGTGYSGVAHVSPGYRQVFKNRYVPLAGQVFGNTNQMIDWTIVSAPTGGDAQLLYSTFPQPVFQSGTVAGQYAIQGCPHVDHSPGACDELAIWVSPNSPPTGNADKVEQVPCDVDTTMHPATIIDIGPSQTFSDLLAVPQSYTAPLLIRVHNEGGDGSPTVYHNQLQVNMPSSGSWDDRHPAVLLCGVPNPRTGELPIIDGDNATTNSWTSPWVLGPYGLISFTAINVGPSVNDGRVKPFHHVTVSGLHIRNVTSGFSYFDQNGAPGNWGGSMGIRPFGLQYWSVIGTHAENVATPYFDDCNTQVTGWSACTLDTFYEGNHGEGYGTNGTYTEHMFYLQAFRDTSMLNLQDGGVPGDLGTTCFSDRGTRSFHMYSRCVPTANYNSGSVMGGHSEIQDAYNYVLPDEFWGYQGASSCATAYSIAPGCSGAFGGEDWFAALTEEHNNSDFVIGNYYYNASGGTKYLGLSTTHNTTGIDNSSQAFYAYNTLLYSPSALPNGGLLWEDTRLGPTDRSTDAYLPVTWPRGQFQNNIIPWKDNTGCAYRCSVLSTAGHAQLTFRTNLIAPGQVTVAPNIQPTGWLAGGIFRNGVNTSWSYYDPGNIAPINQFLGGFTASNFIPYNLFPVDSNTGVAVSGSNAIGAASLLVGQLSYYPPRFSPVTANLDPFALRTDLTTVGATDPGNARILTSIAIIPNPVVLTRSGTAQLIATCTFADSSISDCTHSASWSTDSSVVHIDTTSAGLIYGDSTGTGTVTATIGSISGTAMVSVTNSSPVLASIAITPNPASLITGGPLQLRAICTYTNVSTADCTNSVSWSTASSSFGFDQSIPGLIHGFTPGTGTVSASIGNVAANSIVKAVQAPVSGTATILTSSVNPSVAQQMVTFTAIVPSMTGASVPTGTVQFKVDGVNLGNLVGLINGTAQFSLSVLEVGNHTIAATYMPDSGSYATSTGSIIQQVNGVSLGQNSPGTIILTTSPNPSTVGQSVLLAATIPPGATGTVQFIDGTTVLGTSSISGTVATFTTTSLSVGTHLMKAVYGGDRHYSSASSAPVTQTVRNILESPVPELTVEPSTSVYGQAVTVTVSVPKMGDIAPTGTATIYYNGTRMGIGTIGANGVALVTLSGGALPVGTGNIMASYSGDGIYTPSNTQSKPITVSSTSVLDFTLALTAGQSQTVISGGAAPIGVHIAPTAATYPGPVTFTATGLPPGATVSFSPSILAADGGPMPVNARVQTATVLSNSRMPRSAAPIALGILLLPLTGARQLRRRGRMMPRYFLLVIILLAGITATTGLSGCGSGYAQHSYDITITATSGTIEHSINATLYVQ